MQLLGLHQSAGILRFKAVTGKQCFTVEMVTMLGKLLGAPQSWEHWKPVEMMETFPTNVSLLAIVHNLSLPTFSPVMSARKVCPGMCEMCTQTHIEKANSMSEVLLSYSHLIHEVQHTNMRIHWWYWWSPLSGSRVLLSCSKIKKKKMKHTQIAN